jgi:segregation and condensation protein B
MDQGSRGQENNGEKEWQDLPLSPEEESMAPTAEETDADSIEVTPSESDDVEPMEEVTEEAAESQEPSAEDAGFVGVTREQVVEALIFSSDAPLPASKLAHVVGGLSADDVRDIVEGLNQKYRQIDCSFQIEEIGGGYQMLTLPEYAMYLQRLYKVRSESKLSGAALETLAVVAYKQPVLRAEVEAVRGVSCGEMIRALMEREMVKIVGRAEELGRPMLYGTTKRFLEIFGLGSLDDLPKVPELLPPTAKREQAKETEELDQTPAPQQPSEEAAGVETPETSETDLENQPAATDEVRSAESSAEDQPESDLDVMPSDEMASFDEQ